MSFSSTSTTREPEPLAISRFLPNAGAAVPSLRLYVGAPRSSSARPDPVQT